MRSADFKMFEPNRWDLNKWHLLKFMISCRAAIVITGPGSQAASHRHCQWQLSHTGCYNLTTALAWSTGVKRCAANPAA
jgi:hypothetical protein